jgi:hypothetical protein
MSSSLLRWSGWSATLGGLLDVAFVFIYALFTHGNTEADRHGTLGELDGGDYCRMSVACPLS